MLLVIVIFYLIIIEEEGRLFWERLDQGPLMSLSFWMIAVFVTLNTYLLANLVSNSTYPYYYHYYYIII